MSPLESSSLRSSDPHRGDPHPCRVTSNWGSEPHSALAKPERLAQETFRVDRLCAPVRLLETRPRSVSASLCLGLRAAKLDQRRQHICRCVPLRGPVRMSGLGSDLHASHLRLACDPPETIPHRERRIRGRGPLRVLSVRCVKLSPRAVTSTGTSSQRHRCRRFSEILSCHSLPLSDNKTS